EATEEEKQRSHRLPTLPSSCSLDGWPKANGASPGRGLSPKISEPGSVCGRTWGEAEKPPHEPPFLCHLPATESPNLWRVPQRGPNRKLQTRNRLPVSTRSTASTYVRACVSAHSRRLLGCRPVPPGLPVFPACSGPAKWEGETQDGGSRELRLQPPAVRLPDLKLIIDEKKYYLFGRNPDLCDFTIDHQSCSRVHAALVYHKHLKRVFLIDLNSTHGTFLGHIRLEPHKPQQIPIDSTVSFGASTRAYTLREKPQTLPSAVKGDEKMGGEDDELKGLLGLPEEETELDNLTEFNTAHNKRISTLTIEEGNLDIQRPKRKRKNSRVTFSEDDEIINPEDVDPSVGRFRNMVQTAVVPVKKKRVDGPGSLGLEESGSRRMQNFAFSGGLYGGLPPTHSEAGSQPHGIHGTALIGGLPMPYPNLAPDVDLTPVVPSAVNMNPAPNPVVYNPEAVNEPKKKKYAKEAWPGKKPTPSLLI
uniref:Protein phosphatase 1 regulatory subunit 8 n=1 Tax=Oryctolagus cuniculus TaxID=9986 RepID=A0A5F9CWJ7_RABIT